MMGLFKNKPVDETVRTVDDVQKEIEDMAEKLTDEQAEIVKVPFAPVSEQIEEMIGKLQARIDASLQVWQTKCETSRRDMEKYGLVPRGWEDMENRRPNGTVEHYEKYIRALRKLQAEALYREKIRDGLPEDEVPHWMDDDLLSIRLDADNAMENCSLWI